MFGVMLASMLLFRRTPRTYRVQRVIFIVLYGIEIFLSMLYCVLWSYYLVMPISSLDILDQQRSGMFVCCKDTIIATYPKHETWI